MKGINVTTNLSNPVFNIIVEHTLNCANSSNFDAVIIRCIGEGTSTTCR